MPIVLAIAALAAFAFFASKKTPGGIASSATTRDVPVMLGDDRTVTKATAKWHATNDQNSLFGPRAPDYWNVNGYFMYANMSGGFDKYKPDWQVAIVGTY